MSLEFYKIMHIIGFVSIFASLGGLWGLSLKGAGPKERRAMALVHGVGMTLVLISGFGMLARLGLTAAMPGWIYGKLGIWLVLGGSMVLAKRKAHLGPMLIVGWVLIGGLAAFFAVMKPF